ncbi:MAG: hypothetical protein ACLRYE_03095 [Gemmiger formicilis]|uniref:hypothetical protein n=1 Tax=Gemmiger formicilis TaxID=745368 RepID=UPI0039A1515B
MQAKAKNMLYDWFVTFRKEGFTEWNSSPYLPIDTLGFGSLYAFAQDPAMRELGREGMDFAYHPLAVHSQQGIFARRRAAPTSRSSSATGPTALRPELDRLWVRRAGPRGQGYHLLLPV